MTFPRLALLLTLAMYSFGLAAQSPGDASERIGGMVTNAVDGRPLAHATVTLQKVEAYGTVAATSSEADGHFRFDPLPPGRYRLSASAHGFVTSSYLEHDGLSSAIVTGHHLPTAALHLQLTPAASISGHVLDESGAPISATGLGRSASVALYCQNRNLSPPLIHICNQTTPAFDGSYEFTNLAPDAYFLTVTAQPWYAIHPPPSSEDAGEPFLSAVDPALDVAYPLLYYPGTPSEERAEPIVLKPGDSFPADFHLLPEHALTLTFPGPPAQSSASEGIVVPSISPKMSRLVFGQEDPVFSPSKSITANGTIYIGGLAPGSYLVAQQRNDAPLPFARRPITLTDQALSVPFASPGASATVTLTLRHPDGTPWASGTNVQLRAGRQVFTAQQVNDKGMAVFSSLPPADYRVRLSVEQAPVRLVVNGVLAADDTLHLTGSAPLAAEVTAVSTVTLQGFAGWAGAASERRNGTLASPSHNSLADSPAHPAVGTMVLLIPASNDPDLALFNRDQSDMDGGFTLRYVAPGNYLLLAIDNAWSHTWTDLHWLAPYLLHAQPVQVPATAKGTIQLPDLLTPQQPR